MLPPKVVAILTAAGSGSRLGARLPKALVPLAGESLLRRAARSLLASQVVGGIVVTAPGAYLQTFTQELQGLAAAEKILVVSGSDVSRQASVACGLRIALSAFPQAEVILVHDAARALTPPALVRAVVTAVRAGHEAVIPVLPVTDTIKEVRPAAPGTNPEGEQVVGTPVRAHLRAVQTPQGFTVSTLRRAHRCAARAGAVEAASACDDASLVEAMGGSVFAIAGDPLALKITTPLDLELAKLLICQP